MSLRTLKRRYQRMNLKRKNAASDDQVLAAVVAEVTEHGNNKGMLLWSFDVILTQICQI